MASYEPSAPLLVANGVSDSYYVEDSVDFRGRPAVRSASGGWNSALLIIGVEISERLAYYGISSNLITFLTGSLHQSNAEAAENVNAWYGVASLLPLAGAFIADEFFGRYRTVLFASILYIIGLALLTLSAMLPSRCSGDASTSSCSSPSKFQVAFFFFSLYLVAVAQSGHKPCTQAFGADQFDETDPQELKSKASFFNWWYFGLCLGTVFAVSVINYIQESVGWALGFGIPCLSMLFALTIFLIGTFTYRFKGAQAESPFTRIAQVFVAAIRKSQWPTEDSRHPSGSTRQLSFLDRAATPLRSDCSVSPKSYNWIVCSVSQVEETKGVLHVIPLWATCLVYAIVFSQSSTFFVKQGNTMERKIGSSFLVPSATLQSFISFTAVMFIPIYDRILVPTTRYFTGIPTGITMLQRIGIGIFLSIVSMIVAALVELRRLKVARVAGLIDFPLETVPMGVWWLVPQYVLFGLADVFTMVGLQEFFYDQMPDSLRSLGLALYLSIFGLGSFLSSFLIALVDKTSSSIGESWFSNNLNRAHVDYFYWLLAGLSTLGFFAFMFCARYYVYKGRTPVFSTSSLRDTKSKDTQCP